MVKIGFIGSGNMASALMKGILDKGITDNLGIISSDKDPVRLKDVKQKLEINTTHDNKIIIQNSDIIFIAVKPQDIDQVLAEIKDEISKQKIIVSIAAGITTSRIMKIIGNKKIVRVMPNTPSLVGAMAAGYTCRNLTDNEKTTIQIILESCGKAIELKEELLDAVTGLSGSGPAFVAYLISAFKESGIENGLSESTSYELALKTFEGTAKLLAKTQMSPEELIKMVSSPKGTTIAGREILEASDVKTIIKKTIKRATDRSRELGQTN
jgi:pyrroline-5-carboxylate reductase